MPPFSYETYQDVRKNLFYYSAITLNLSGFAAYQWILPLSHRQWVDKIVAQLTSNSILGGLLTGGVGVALFTGLASVLIEIIKVHDAIYDKYVVRWRLRYDTDFILQRLLKPFAVDLELFLEGPTDFAITITRRKITRDKRIPCSTNRRPLLRTCSHGL